jgi:hypothetical protein
MRTVIKWKRQWRQNYQFQTQEAESPKKPSNAMASSDLPTNERLHQRCCTKTEEDTDPNVESLPGANADQAINI